MVSDKVATNSGYVGSVVILLYNYKSIEVVPQEGVQPGGGVECGARQLLIKSIKDALYNTPQLLTSG